VTRGDATEKGLSIPCSSGSLLAVDPVDRFAPGESNHGKGTKAEPGWFYGFAKDVWQATALAVYAADTGDGAGHV